jgi:hypothetical protein
VLNLEAVLLLMRLVTSFQIQWPGFEPSSGHVGLVVQSGSGMFSPSTSFPPVKHKASKWTRFHSSPPPRQKGEFCLPLASFLACSLTLKIRDTCFFLNVDLSPTDYQRDVAEDRNLLNQGCENLKSSIKLNFVMCPRAHPGGTLHYILHCLYRSETPNSKIAVSYEARISYHFQLSSLCLLGIRLAKLQSNNINNKFCGLSSRTNYTDQAIATWRRS